MKVNVPAGSSMCQGLTVEQLLSQLGIWFVEYVANIKQILYLKSNNINITDVKEMCKTLAAQFAFNSTSE